MKKNNINIFLIFLIFFSFSGYSQNTNWEVPSDKKTVKNSVLTSKNVVEKGKSLYEKNCQSCHGIPLKNNGISLFPPPPDVGSQKVLSQSDGELFYKISVGRGSMPSFQNVISDEGRWSIIHFFRQLSQKKNVQKLKNIKITYFCVDSSQRINVEVFGENEKNEKLFISDAEMDFLIKRNFGLLLLRSEKTDFQGKTSILFSQNLPADSLGNLEIIISLKEDSRFDKVEVKLTKKWGIIPKTMNFNEIRALWSLRARSPFWLIFSYFGVVFGVWFGIFYVLFLLLKIYKSGGKNL